MKVHIEDETSRLRAVVVGIASNFGAYPMNNPKIAKHAANKTLPKRKILEEQVDGLSKLLQDLNVKVYRPSNIPKTLQIFTRDLGFVIGDTFVWGNHKLPSRQKEQNGIRQIIKRLRIKSIRPPRDILIEGGDVVCFGKKIFVGIGIDEGKCRTTGNAVAFLRKTFPKYKVIALMTRASDKATDSPIKNILHLDCAFQPVGGNCAIVFPEGFYRPKATLKMIQRYIKKIICVDGKGMYNLWPNIVSISPNVVISENKFRYINAELENLGLTVIKVPYGEVSKLGGLFRCSTLPLLRG